MDLGKNEGEMQTVYQTIILGAEEILKRIEDVPWKEKILLKNDGFLENKKYEKVLLDSLEFFTPQEEVDDIVQNLEELFLPLPEEHNSHEEIQVLFCRKGRKDNPRKIFLEIRKEPDRIPFELHIISFPGHEVFPQKKEGIYRRNGEKFIYYMFPPEEYLAFAFYEIIKNLELIKDMSWYKEVYEVLYREAADGRKVWESLNRLIKEYPIPSLEKRLDTLIGYKEYGYMQKRWKSQGKRRKEKYPDWEEVITLIQTFLTPIFDGILKDEIFLGDWMPELGRYLD